MLLYIWKKSNGEIVCRITKDFFPTSHVGDFNAYGWELLSIQAVYKFRFYNYDKVMKYNNFINRKKSKLKSIFSYFLKHIFELILILLLLILIIKK